MSIVLLVSVFVIATCGLVYELIAGALASYLLGDSITQFSTVIGSYLFAMGIGSWGSKYVEGVLSGAGSDDEEGGGEGGDGNDAESDPLYDQAVDIVLKNRRASISLVQRHLRIGYNRAARLLEQMEKSGLVSAMSTNGNRDIIVPNRSE